MLKHNSHILICGANGMVGSAFERQLSESGFTSVFTPSRGELDLSNKAKTSGYINKNKINTVIIAAAMVGGIKANNDFPYDFLFRNLEIQNSVISSAHELNVQNLIFLGSSCIYPRNCKQPISENELLSSKLEKTNEAYAIAKIAGVKLIESLNIQFNRDYFSIMPCNLYGINDYYHPSKSHVIPSLIRKFHSAKVHEEPAVEVWGSGLPRREFLFADDLAAAGIFLLQQTKRRHSLINVGSGEDITIKELAKQIQKVVGYDGELKFNSQFPDGTPQKLLNVQKITDMGWKPKTKLSQGLAKTYKDFLNNIEELRQ